MNCISHCFCEHYIGTNGIEIHNFKVITNNFFNLILVRFQTTPCTPMTPVNATGVMLLKLVILLMWLILFIFVKAQVLSQTADTADLQVNCHFPGDQRLLKRGRAGLEPLQGEARLGVLSSAENAVFLQLWGWGGPGQLSKDSPHDPQINIFLSDSTSFESYRVSPTCWLCLTKEKFTKVY